MTEPRRHDPLAELRDQLHATRAAAERLAGEAAQAATAAAAGEQPPPGWRTPREREAVRDELDALAELLRTIRALLPPELEQQLADLVRQILLLLRALIDWLIDQVPAVGGERPPLRDVPLA